MALQSMEEEADRIYKDERGSLLDDEAASTRDAMWVLSSLIWFELIWRNQVHDWAVPLPHIAQLYARVINGLDSGSHYRFAEATYFFKEKFLDFANILMSPLFFFFFPPVLDTGMSSLNL